MKHDKVLITRENMERLQCLLDSRKSAGDRDRARLEILAQKLDSARVVASDRIPQDVVTLNSQVRLNHLDGG